jgi:lipopolysaccharide export system protein LptA
VKRALLLVALALPGPQAFAAGKPADQKVSILPGGDAKAPIAIEADRLDYFEKEGKAVYDGHVVVVQGDTKLTCSKLTILMDKTGSPAAQPAPAKPEPAKAEGAAPGGDASSRLKHMDCSGPVTVASKTQTATADNGSYDKGRSNVVLSGHVVLTDGRNVTKGERLVYDLNTGQAAVQGGGQRVQGLFLPGGAETGAGGKKK